MHHLKQGAAALLLLFAVASCGDDGRPVNIPVIAPGAYEARCQTMCTVPAGQSQCSKKHAEYCVASCRLRTNDLPQACADCLFTKGKTIRGYRDDFFEEDRCDVGGPAEVSSCRTECDDASAVAATNLTALCQLSCSFYMQDSAALACSSENAATCLNTCATTIASKGRICATCEMEQVSFSTVCINDDCDCEPSLGGGSCDTLCDTMPP